MRYGRTVEEGFLPVYSVDTEQEARSLLVLSCSTNLKGEFLADELVREQTLENLDAFGNRLERNHKMMQEHAKKNESRRPRQTRAGK